MTCNRVTSQKRGLIHQWRQAGIGNNEIARRLSRNPSSISRGIKRNPSRRGYRPKQAQAQALAEERAKRPGPRRFTEAVRKYAEGKLRQGWTPDIICGRARLKGRAHVCKETVYKHIYADAANGGAPNAGASAGPPPLAAGHGVVYNRRPTCRDDLNRPLGQLFCSFLLRWRSADSATDLTSVV